MERVSFIFDGKLAQEHRMDFYEVARFQYSASRLLVKLDNYRRNGSFPKKITYKNAPDILILPQRAGSYGLDVIIPAAAAVAPVFLNVSLESLLSYVVDRIFHSADDDNVRAALATQNNLIDAFEQDIAGRDNTIGRTLDLLANQMDQNVELNQQNRELYERLLADRDRKLALAEQQNLLRRINQDDEAELVTMAAPLLKEMNVPLRKSARILTIRTATNDNFRSILSADKIMADAVDTEVVDRRTTKIDINIIQFNKENGWGKFENDDWEGRPSFSIPGEILDDFKQTAMNAMQLDLVEVECKFVRSSAGIPIRIIVLDINEIDDD